MPKSSNGIGLCPDLAEMYGSLKAGDFKRLIDEMTEVLLLDCQAGNQIPRNRIPGY